jgi:hypothetical protein
VSRSRPRETTAGGPAETTIAPACQNLNTGAHAILTKSMSIFPTISIGFSLVFFWFWFSSVFFWFEALGKLGKTEENPKTT